MVVELESPPEPELVLVDELPVELLSLVPSDTVVTGAGCEVKPVDGSPERLQASNPDRAR